MPPGGGARPDAGVPRVTTIIVTWMDGSQETYRARSYEHGVHHLSITTDNDRVLGGEPERYVIPLNNVKIWKAER